MSLHTTNYINTFIEVAEDCPANIGEIPPTKGDKQSIASMQFELIHKQPYRYSSDDVIFHCYATKQDLTPTEFIRERELFFSKGQACMRSSPLTKRYGWGIHSNEEGKVALYAVESDEYKNLAGDSKLKVVKAMRSKRRAE